MTAGAAAAPLLLHVFPSFAVGGAQVRFAALANRFGDRWRHAVVALDGRTDCAERIGAHVPFRLLPAPAARDAGLSRFPAIRKALRQLAPAALVTSNWGSIEWAMVARTIPALRHIHTEDGFGPDEAAGQKPRRVLARRLVLRHSAVVLPSRTLLGIARGAWRLPEACLHYIANGLDLARFTADGPRLALPAGEGPLIGTVATLRPEKNLGRLLEACAMLRAEGVALRLAIIGDGPARAGLEARAATLGLSGVAHFAGPMPDPAPAYRSMDLFALSSDTEQMPFSVLEAMATGLAVAATDVGDVRSLLAPANHPYVVAPDAAVLAGALRPLLRDGALRARLGAENRARVARNHDQEAMFQAYARLLDGAP